MVADLQWSKCSCISKIKIKMGFEENPVCELVFEL